jgi:rare lipoprotein A
MPARSPVIFLALSLLGLAAIGCGGGAEATRGGAASPTTSAAVGSEQRGRASYYSDKLAGHATASGEPYQPAELTAAHRTLPFGAMVEVVRVSDGRHVAVRINDRGPFHGDRVIDVSRRAAEALGIVRDGVAEVVLRVVSLPPARKKSRRR